MNESNPGNSQPIIGSDQPFIVNVKLLSNEVYEIQARPTVENVPSRCLFLISKKRLRARSECQSTNRDWSSRGNNYLTTPPSTNMVPQPLLS